MALKAGSNVRYLIISLLGYRFGESAYRRLSDVLATLVGDGCIVCLRRWYTIFLEKNH